MSDTSAAPAPRVFPTLMGAFGVAMGFAAFALVRGESQDAQASPATFLLGLLAAAVTSYVIEAVRERAEGHAGGARVEPGRVLGLLVLLAIFEVFVSGAEEVVRLVAGGGAATFVDQLFATGITSQLGLVVQLLLFTGLWMALGAAAAWSVSLDDPPDATVAVAARLATRRVVRGLALVAAIALGYIVLLRLALTVWILLVRPQDYAPAFSTLLPEPGRSAGNPLGWLPVAMAAVLEWIAGRGRWGGLVLLTIATALGVVLGRTTGHAPAGMGRRLAATTTGGALALLALGPLVTSSRQFSQLLHIVVASTAIWLAPLIVLAVAAPRLRAPARRPRLWGIVACVVAAVLVGVTWDRLSSPPASLFVATLVVALLVTGWLFLRGADVVQFWPLVALTLGIAAFEGSSVLRRLTFLTTFKEAALLQSAPLRGGDEAREGTAARAVARWGRDGWVPPSAARLVAQVDALDDAAMPASLTTLRAQLDRAVDSAYVGDLRVTCASSGSPPLDALLAPLGALCARAGALGDTTWAGAVAVWEATAKALAGPGGLSAWLAGAGADVTTRALDFRWRDPASESSVHVAERARTALGRVEEDPPAEVMIRLAMEDSTASPTVRLWRVLDGFARSAPPADQLAAWLDTKDSTLLRSEGVKGQPDLATVMEWWFPRVRQLGALVEARYGEGMPADRPSSGIGGRPLPVTRDEGQVRTLLALRFAARQVRARLEQRERGDALEADAGAAIQLELALGASFAFWATAGLLAGLAGRARDDEAAPRAT